VKVRSERCPILDADELACYNRDAATTVSSGHVTVAFLILREYEVKHNIPNPTCGPEINPGLELDRKCWEHCWLQVYCLII
jgi:hypothetical protein